MNLVKNFIRGQKDTIAWRVMLRYKYKAVLNLETEGRPRPRKRWLDVIDKDSIRVDEYQKTFPWKRKGRQSENINRRLRIKTGKSAKLEETKLSNSHLQYFLVFCFFCSRHALHSSHVLGFAPVVVLAYRYWRQCSTCCRSPS